MDKFFILYTQPSAPYIDQQGRLLIPLRSIQDLMGGKVFLSSLHKNSYCRNLKAYI